MSVTTTSATRSAIIVALVLLATTAAATRAEAKGNVLSVDGDDIYVDVGNLDGVGDGSGLRLMHVIMATHPVTKKKVRDTFFLGTLTVVRAGKRVSVAHADPELLPRVTVGDELEIEGAAPVADPWEESARASRRKVGVEDPIDDEGDPDADGKAAAAEAARRKAERAAVRASAQADVDAEDAARETWRRSLGKPPAERVMLWADFLKRHPKSKHAPAVRAEIASLEQQEQADDERARLAAEGGADPEAGPGPLAELGELDDVVIAGPLAYAPPARIYEGAAFELSYLILDPGAVKAGWVHYRKAGEDTFARAELALDGDSFLRARIPSGTVHAPRFEYFVEVMAPEGTIPQSVVGSAEAPATIAVDASVEEPPRDSARRSRVSLYFDYVDFDGYGANKYDQYIQFEADFMYRFRKPIYAMRLGIATLAGKGGPKDVIDLHQECIDNRRDQQGNIIGTGMYACRRVSYNYVYAEFELAANELLHVMLRPMYGGGFQTRNDDDDLPVALDEFGGALGFRARVRIGREMETNLVLGVGHIGLGEGDKNFGTLFEAAFTWDVLKLYPILLSAQVSDQPVPEDFGVRLIADVGWRGLPWVYPSLRVSYQARDIDHQGISAGGGLNFDW